MTFAPGERPVRCHGLAPNRAEKLAWLLLAFHTIVLMRSGTWHSPVGWLVAALLAGGTWALPVALIWIAHIGADRALGYGLKYDRFHVTHLGLIGKAKNTHRADTR